MQQRGGVDKTRRKRKKDGIDRDVEKKKTLRAKRQAAGVPVTKDKKNYVTYGMSAFVSPSALEQLRL